MIRGGARCWVRPGEPRPRESLLLCTNIRLSDSHNMRVRSIPSTQTCLCSSAVEQGFCKAQVASSNLVEGLTIS